MMLIKSYMIVKVLKIKVFLIYLTIEIRSATHLITSKK